LDTLSYMNWNNTPNFSACSLPYCLLWMINLTNSCELKRLGVLLTV